MAVKDIKRIKYYLLLVLMLTGLPHLQGQQISRDITKAFRTGDAELLAGYFNARIKLSILNKEYDPSQTQAKEIMREFFREHPCESFEVKFESEKKDSRFIIGNLKTTKGNFRVNVFFKKFDEGDLIHLLRIEKENESTF